MERLGRERLVVILSLASVVALAWLWLWRQAAAMEMAGMQMAGMPAPDAVGVMSLAWVAAIAAFVLVEKLLPAGRVTARASGAALIALAVATLLL